ncbi:hypothetical protein MAIC_17890 [Mycolicibacterium aichiense]|uniref:Uncharacterized protein n=1 Tax=Mycolicibacterium aichiense TaxID=1799 RepID=A0AAD1HKV9_9MYCO|nr:hypothetical protein MAIC_17890 [Mycolicibacterium aichiense]
MNTAPQVGNTVIITSRPNARKPEAKCAIGDIRITTGLVVDSSGARREAMAAIIPPTGGATWGPRRDLTPDQCGGYRRRL